MQKFKKKKKLKTPSSIFYRVNTKDIWLAVVKMKTLIPMLFNKSIHIQYKNRGGLTNK